MDKQAQQVARGEEAQRLLTNPLLAQAFEETRRAFLEALASLPVAGDDVLKQQQLDLLRSVKVIDKVKKVLEEHVATGKIAQKQIEGMSKQPFLSRWK